jgi:hypothetical protein
VTVTLLAPSPPVASDAGQEIPAGLPRTDGRVPWRTAGIGLTSLGAPIGIGVADPLLGQIAIVIELAVALTIIGTALFGSQALSERAFRLLRWIANRPEPPGPAAPAVTPKQTGNAEDFSHPCRRLRKLTQAVALIEVSLRPIIRGNGHLPPIDSQPSCVGPWRQLVGDLRCYLGRFSYWRA